MGCTTSVDVDTTGGIEPDSVAAVIPADPSSHHPAGAERSWSPLPSEVALRSNPSRPGPSPDFFAAAATQRNNSLADRATLRAASRRLPSANTWDADETSGDVLLAVSPQQGHHCPIAVTRRRREYNQPPTARDDSAVYAGPVPLPTAAASRPHHPFHPPAAAAIPGRGEEDAAAVEPDAQSALEQDQQPSLPSALVFRGTLLTHHSAPNAHHWASGSANPLRNGSATPRQEASPDGPIFGGSDTAAAAAATRSQPSAASGSVLVPSLRLGRHSRPATPEALALSSDNLVLHMQSSTRRRRECEVYGLAMPEEFRAQGGLARMADWLAGIEFPWPGSPAP